MTSAPGLYVVPIVPATGADPQRYAVVWTHGRLPAALRTAYGVALAARLDVPLSALWNRTRAGLPEDAALRLDDGEGQFWQCPEALVPTVRAMVLAAQRGALSTVGAP